MLSRDAAHKDNVTLKRQIKSPSLKSFYLPFVRKDSPHKQTQVWQKKTTYYSMLPLVKRIKVRKLFSTDNHSLLALAVIQNRR